MAHISNNDIAKAIYLGAKDKSGMHLEEAMKNTVKILSRKRLLSRAPDILKRLAKIESGEKGILQARAKSSKKLSGDEKSKIIHFLKHWHEVKDVILEEEIKEELLGGVRIEVDDEVIDLSVKRRIGELKEFLMSNT